jgi:ABC-type Na+ efflux pump permease subunit
VTKPRLNRRTGARLVAWLDLRSPEWIWLNHLWTALALGVPVAFILTIGIHTKWQSGILRVREICVLALYLIVIVRTATTVTHSIGREKDACTWTGLLLTPLSNRQILWGKVWSVMVTNVTGWMVLFASLVAFNWAMNRVGRFMQPDMTKWRLALAVAQMLGYGLFAMGAGLFFAIHLRNSLSALIAALAALVGSYALYQYGLQPWFASAILPKLMAQGDQMALMRGVFTYAFSVAGAQCLVGLLLGLIAQWRLRRVNVA